MCGIFGIYNIKTPKKLQKEIVEISLLKMKYRGPDARNIKMFDDSAILGHLRLSIIDLKPESSQPFQLDDRYWITFNGEIYNYIELRNDLITEGGYTFRTESDTEVLLRAYIHWGENCVNKFNGMWAFAIYDALENKLFCSRDRFGVKPFNYALIDGQFIFSSEIKAILTYFPKLKEPNYNSIANYCRTSVGAQNEETWFKDVYRLQPAHNMIVTEEGIKKYRYWQYPTVTDNTINFEDAKSRYLALLTDAVNLRMRSDVPVGSTLSSGIDSGSIVSLLRTFFQGKHDTYTAVFDEKDFNTLEKKNYQENIEINEKTLVERLTKELNLTPHYLEAKFDNYLSDLQFLVKHLESGHSSQAILPLNKILEAAKKEVTVVLEGQGADELLGGYINTAFFPAIIELIKAGKIKTAIQEYQAFKKYYSISQTFILFIRQWSNKWHFLQKMYFRLRGINIYGKHLTHYIYIKDHVNEPPETNSYFNRELIKQHTGGLVNLLHYGDAISMAHSLESRLPFMDYRLVEFAFSLPFHFKMKQGLGKFIHRISLDAIVPDYILKNPIKFGFSTPLHKLFLSSNNNGILDILESEKLADRQLFKKNAIKELIDEHQLGKKDHSRLLFRVLQIELWFQEFIDR